MWDSADRLITCNQVYRDLYQVSSPLISRGAKFEDIIRGGVLLGQYPQAGTDVEEFVRRTVQWHRSNRGSVERLLPDGRWLLITERHTTWGGIVGIRTDITALKHASAELTAAHERVRQAMVEAQEHNMALIGRDHALHAQNVLFTAALDNMQHGLLMTDAAQRVIVCNARFLDLFGLSKAAAAPGTATAAVFHSIQLAGSLDGEFATQIEHDQTTLATTSRAGNFVTVDRQGRALRIAQRPMPDGGWIATYEDVTEQQQAEDRIRFMAHHDALTKLPNRVLLRSRLEEALHDRRSRGEELALLYLDLDRFKDVNDSLGHPVGDALLVAAAQRLRLCVRESDIVARLGGDEFAVLYRSPNLPGAALQLGERIIEALSATYDVAERTAVVGASVGVAIAAGPEQDVDSLLRKADLALYQAKAEGRGRCCLFEATMDVQFRARLALEADLRRAVAEQEFEVWYQPIWDLGQNRLCGFEALLRWDTGARGFVSPSTFVPVAEEMGLISDIGTWVLNQACTDAKTLPDHIRVAVNLSPLQLRDDGIVDIVAAALQRSGLAPDRLELEITESALLRDNASTGKLLAQLHGLGLRIALDDFGTGFSSLSHLRSFPFDKIKIDQSFVRDMAIRQDCAAIVESVAGLASKLGMITTAEGVETMAELALVREAGCTQAQGYIFGIPKPLRHAAADMIEEAPGRWALTT
jgi:diguanylate cyclase (GGDEF)-like protein